MKKLLQLLAILQLTKEQPLTGYICAGIKGNEIPSLAEHHYSTVLMSYFLTQKIKQAGGKINERKLMLMLLVHDLSELFGGDIAGPLHRKYPDLGEHKDKIGERALAVLGEFLETKNAEELQALFNEFEKGTDDETFVAKIIDQMDHQLFLEHHNCSEKFKTADGGYRNNFVKKQKIILI